MNSLKGYFAPKVGKNGKRKGSEKRDGQDEKGHELTPPGVPLSGTQTPSSSRNSMFPYGDFRNSSLADVNEIKCDVMVNWLFQQQQERLWNAGTDDEGVILKKSRGRYTCCPETLRTPHNFGLFAAVELLNVRVALTLNTRVIKLFLHNNEKPFVPLKDGLRLQVLPDITFLPRCQKHQFAAFIADKGLLVVWDDEPRNLLERAAKIEEQLMELIWRGRQTTIVEESEEEKVAEVNIDEVEAGDDTDLEVADKSPHRKIVLIQPFLTACTLLLTIAAIGGGLRQIAQEIKVDNSYMRVVLVVFIPAQIWLALFFFQALAGNVAQLFGPISQMNANTKFYSGVPPRRLQSSERQLPHVTIQCPVYKEGLTAVIEPTIRSLKAAISTYEMQGGTANIFINDDGMQLISEEDAQRRQDFYDEHNIGWVARPAHNPKPEEEGVEPFVRRGKFKKASNMNYALWVSNRIEEKLAAFERPDTWTNQDEGDCYKSAMSQVIAEDQGRTWCDGNIRVGDYILLVDSDTRVPNDCLLDAVSEMEESPQVAIIQYSSGVMNVTQSFFEKGITFFTNLIYTQIKFAVANGDVAPFVGHNAVLRWSAVQGIAYECALDNREKYWSEATVSEDFDMALRLQTNGYVVRLAAYTGDGFKEGVSLTVYDELARWEKYAYGCSELIFHPVRYWFVRGPITPLFRKFIASNMPLPSKLTILAYVGTYYAIGSAWLLTLANYFLTGWFIGHLDHYYVDSFKIYFAIVIVFSGFGNVALAVLRYRIEESSLARGFYTNLMWVPLMTIFLGGISIHVSQAILSHLFSIDMAWGATAKEVENTTFFSEIPKVLKKFKFTFIFCIVVAVAMVALARFVPDLWQIRMFVAIWPLATIIFSHFFLPIALNPNLMLFTW